MADTRPQTRNVTVVDYKYGTISILEPESIKRGAASASKNWLTKGDHIELRGGSAYLGSSSVNSGTGKATGLRKASDALGVEVLFGTYAKKAKYYTTTTGEWTEIGSDLLGAAVLDSDGIGEDIFISEYVSLAGNQVFLNSPNCAGFFKIMTANPGSSADQYDAAKNFKGNIKIDTNRTFLWGRVKDETGIYGSKIDTQTYTSVTGEATTSLTGTLAFKASHPKATCFAVQITITSGGEVFTDDYCGVLTGSAGHTGTINYTTGDYTLSAAGVGTAAYQWEDSTVGGIADFTKSSPRVAAEGFIFRQDEGGGPVQNVSVYSTVYYCFHTKKTWALNIGADDTTATNLPYRDKVGIPNVRASVETGDGIYYIDDQNPAEVKIRLLTYGRGAAQQVIPVPISSNLNLNAYLFDEAAGIEYGDLILFACRTSKSPINDTVLCYNKIWKAWDTLDYNVSCFEIFEGVLIAGDSLSNNFLVLFSGFDDFEGSLIDNYWIGNSDQLDAEGLKKSKKMYLNGLIVPDQAYDVYVSVDQGAFVKVYTVDGSANYVNRGQEVLIGSGTAGTHVIGDGSAGNVAYPYEVLFPITLGKGERFKVKYVATGIGYVSISEQRWWDVRFKGKKVPQQYRV